MDNAEAGYAAKGRRDAVVAGMSASSAAKLSGSSATYSFDVTLNGAISTEGGAVLLEKSQLVGVVYPLRNNQKDATLLPYTGKVQALDTLYEIGALVFRGDSTSPGSPPAPVPAPELAFSWNGFTALPYAYTTDDPTLLPSLLTGPGGRGRGQAHVAQGELAPHHVLTPGGRATRCAGGSPRVGLAMPRRDRPVSAQELDGDRVRAVLAVVGLHAIDDDHHHGVEHLPPNITMAMGPMKRISTIETTKNRVKEIWKFRDDLPCSLTKSESDLPIIQTIRGPRMLPKGTMTPLSAMRWQSMARVFSRSTGIPA